MCDFSRRKVMAMTSLSLLLAALAVVRADPSPAAQLEFDPNFVDLGRLPGSQTTPRPQGQTSGFQNRQFDVAGGRPPIDGFSQRPYDRPFDGRQQPFGGVNQQPFDASGRPLPFSSTRPPPFDVASGGRYPPVDGGPGGPGFRTGGRSFDGGPPRTLFGDVGQDQINGPSAALPGAPRPAASYPGDRDRYNGPGLNGDAPLLRPLGLDGPDGLPGPPLPPVPPPNYIPEGELRELLTRVDSLTSQQCTHTVAAQWAFETNVNAVTQVSALEAQLQNSELQRAVRETLNQVDLNLVENPDLARQIRLLSIIGPAALPPDQLDRYNGLINSMLAVYNSATICAHREPLRCGLRLDPDLTLIMARSRDWDELQYVWLEWRRRSGFKIRDLFEQLVDLSNVAAKYNNLTTFADYWMFPYETPDFRVQLETAWEEVRPLFEQLHAYVRRKLRDFYGPEKISRQAPLPAHILGNMWAQSWSNILDITIPYPGKNFLDVGPQMASQGYTPSAMFRLAEEFYTSMNMSAMPAEFWSHSVLEEPPARVVVCQPSAWDFCNRKDFRIKMCTHVNMNDLVTAHHEMAHVQYFMEYKNLPKIYRDGANPGLHEAIGEAISLSVATPRHLQALGLVQTAVDDLPHNINYLFALALDKLPFLPFSLALDKWRWDVFQKRKTKDQYNCHYWFLRERFSGIKPPFLRSEFDFDPGAKFHVPANIPYIKYFVATILQFQIHKAMCRAAGQYDPENDDLQLHKCDIYRSKEAGKVLKKLMEQGSSVPWTEALHAATGESRLNGSALREFFRPLEEWLQNENLRTAEFVGWTYDGDYCKRSIETAGLEVYGGFYNAAPGGAGASTHIILSLTLLALMLRR